VNFDIRLDMLSPYMEILFVKLFERKLQQRWSRWRHNRL